MSKLSVQKQKRTRNNGFSQAVVPRKSVIKTPKTKAKQKQLNFY